MYFTIRQSYTRTVSTLVTNTQASVVAQALRNFVDQAGSSLPYGLWPWQQVDLRTPSSSFNPLLYPPIYAASSLAFFNPGNHANGTDFLMVQGVVVNQLATNSISASDGQANITTTLEIGNKDYVLLADRSGYQVMKATAAASGGIVSVEQGPARNYGTESFLAESHVYILYLREVSGVRSLMINIDEERTPQGAISSDELIQNIDNFQIRYYFNGSWNDVIADGNAAYLNLWYKAVKGIEITYTINKNPHTMRIALKSNIL